jgi:trigger factor
MNVTVTNQEHCKKQVRLEIPAGAVRAEIDKTAATLARKISIPGFRRGRVPPAVVKSRFRKEIRDDVVSHLLPEALRDAIREKDLKMVGEPSLEELKFNDDESIDVTFSVQVAPEFELANYKNLPLRRRVYKVRDEDVEEAINSLRQQHAELVPVENRGAQRGDTVIVNAVGRFEPAPQERRDSSASGAQIDDDASDDGQADIDQQDLEIELGGPGVLTEFTEALLEARVGDERTLTVRYPDGYKPEKYAGRLVNYTLEVTAVRTKELPELDDQFAEEVGEASKTVGDLRAEIRAKYEREAASRAERELERAALDQLLARNRFEVPEFAVNLQLDARMKTFLRGLAARAVDPRQLSIDWQGLRDSQRETAGREVRGMYILDKIALTEGLEVSDDELNSELERMAGSAGEQVAVLKARLTREGGLDSIREQIRTRKALEFVIACADIRVEEVEGLGASEG